MLGACAALGGRGGGGGGDAWGNLEGFQEEVTPDFQVLKDE